MHHTIQMIPIEALVHHPDNPRKDLGDLKELIASIKASGIMQNLTVVPNPADEETWLVVIGNRRLEASKAAGVKKLPCIISDMDYKTQLATMMAENMQRVDLTVVEQAQGVQLMMDLGMDVAEISRKTGIRKDAVERRTLMLKYDSAKVEKAIAKGGTISDFVELDKVQDESRRQRLLEDIGTPNFRNHLRGALEDQADWKRVGDMAAKMETFATRITVSGEVNGRKKMMLEVNKWHRPDAKAVAAFETPKDVKSRRYYYLIGDGYPCITMLAAVEDAEDVKAYQEGRKTRRDRLGEAYKAAWNRAEQINKRHRQLRIDFVKNGAGLKIDREFLFARLLNLAVHSMGYINGISEPVLCDLLNVDHIGKTGEIWWMEALQTHQAYAALCILLVKLDDGYKRPYTTERDPEVVGSRPVHRTSPELTQLYEILTHCGYEMSDEEIAMMGGSHDVYKKPEVEG